MSDHSLSTYIKDYFFPLMDIPIEENLKHNFINAIEKKDKNIFNLKI